MTWMANIRSSMFYNVYRFMEAHGETTRIGAFTKSYRLYLELVEQQGGEVVLDFTRAWTMVRFFDGDLLQLSTCTRCAGQFVAHAHDGQPGYVCVLCRPPSRAGKLRRTPDDAAPRPALLRQPAPKSASTSASQWLAQVMRSAHA